MNKFCADIHNNLTINLTAQGLKISPCCWAKKSSLVSIGDDFWNSPQLMQLRESNKLGQLDHDVCKQCIYMEQHGNVSRRTGVNEYYKTQDTDLPGPRGLEITIDYTCNIACVICGPGLSTQWRLELGTPKKQFPIRLARTDIISILDSLDLSNLDNIHFYGGDPLFTNTHEEILNYIDQRVGLGKIYVWYNTNGTLRVNQRVQELWSRCRLIKVYFSIDDIGPRFEYIRYGAVWNQVEDNMLWYKETMPSNVMFVVQPTISCLNALHHCDLLAWKQKHFNTNREGDATDLTRHNVFDKFELNSMPDELVRQVVSNNADDQWFVEFVKSFKFDARKLAITQYNIAKLDKRRGCSFSATFPDLVQYFVKQ